LTVRVWWIPVQDTKLGSCKLIEEIMIGEDRLIHFSGESWGQCGGNTLRCTEQGGA